MLKKLFTIFMICFSLAACSQKPIVTTSAPTASATPSVEGTQMAVASPTPWVAGTQIALAVSSPIPFVASPFVPPTFTLEAMEKPTDFSPVLYGKKYDANTFFLLLGGVSRHVWLAPDVSVARFAGEATYGIHTVEIVDKYFFWGKAPEFAPTCRSYLIGTDIDVNETGMVATLDGWDVTKHAVTELSANGQFYQQVVLDWLASEGVSAPQIGFMQIFRVDIEGDGTDEIFISATHLDESQHTTKAGDYSIILMRKVAGNDAVTKFIVGDVYDSQDLEITYPRTYSLGNFIDLNQDGILEVVVDIQQWEGFGAIVYQVDDQEVIQTLRAEC